MACTQIAKWIEETGKETIAKKLNVSRSNVHQWGLGYVLPRPEIMLEIMIMTKGAISPTLMIKEHFMKTNKNRKSFSRKE